MVSLLVALALAAHHQQRPPRAVCGIVHPEVCATKFGFLVEDPLFEREVKRFAGDVHGNYTVIEGPVSKQLTYAMESVATDPRLIAPGTYLYEGCLKLFCVESGAVILEKGHILAAALIAVSNSEHRRNVHIFLHESQPRRDWLVAELEKWSKEPKFGDETARVSGYGVMALPLGRTEVHIVRDRK